MQPQREWEIRATERSHKNDTTETTTTPGKGKEEQQLTSTENVQRSNEEFLIRPLDANKKSNPTSGRKNNLSNDGGPWHGEEFTDTQYSKLWQDMHWKYKCSQ